MLKDLAAKNRSYRRFYQDERISIETLKELLDVARLSPSAGNLQPLKYILSNEKLKNALIFPNLMWAGYLKDWKGPSEDERPTAYIIILGDKDISQTFGCDHGIAAQSILLGAAEKGLGGCMIGSIRRKELQMALRIPEKYEILLVLAIGRPKEKVIIENIVADGNIRYWRDENDRHHVPKRSLEELIIE